MRPAPRIAGLALATAVLLSACGGDADPSSDATVRTPEIVVTTSILGDVVATLVGDDGEVAVLVPPGVDPRGYAPSAADAERLRSADLVVVNGLGLEENLADLIGGAEDEGVPVLHVAPELDPIPFALGGHGDSHGEDDHDADVHAEEGDDPGDESGDEGPLDPHVWFDPLRMAEGARLIGQRLAELDVAPADIDWAARAAAYAEQLERLDLEVAATLDRVPPDRRVLVTNHDSLGYLADRYGFELLGTVIPGSSTQAEANPRAFAALAAAIREAGVGAIFAETTDSTRLAEALAAEVGEEVEIVELYTGSLGEPGSGAESYPDLLRLDAERIAAALGGRARAGSGR